MILVFIAWIAVIYGIIRLLVNLIAPINHPYVPIIILDLILFGIGLYSWNWLTMVGILLLICFIDIIIIASLNDMENQYYQQKLKNKINQQEKYDNEWGIINFDNK